MYRREVFLLQRFTAFAQYILATLRSDFLFILKSQLAPVSLPSSFSVSRLKNAAERQGDER